MYPILPPGSFVQVDETKNKVGEGIWRSEYERPIYFVEMRDGYTCCWCSTKRDSIVLQPHPLSPVPVRVLKYPQEAEQENVAHLLEHGLTPSAPPPPTAAEAAPAAASDAPAPTADPEAPAAPEAPTPS